MITKWRKFRNRPGCQKQNGRLDGRMGSNKFCWKYGEFFCISYVYTICKRLINSYGWSSSSRIWFNSRTVTIINDIIQQIIDSKNNIWPYIGLYFNHFMGWVVVLWKTWSKKRYWWHYLANNRRRKQYLPIKLQCEHFTTNQRWRDGCWQFTCTRWFSSFWNHRELIIADIKTCRCLKLFHNHVPHSR